MTITLESSIIHILNTAEEYPILSNRPFLLDSEVKDYLTKTIEKTISSDDVKNCFFRSETNIWQQCKDVSWDLISVSQSIAKENRNRYRSVVLSGKTTTGERQRQYDLYEEYFKYPISVSEYRQENGQKIEREKAEILRDYRLNMMNVYNDYKDIILAVSNR